MVRRSEDGFLLDEWDNEFGICNACGEEAMVGLEDCCGDGEVVPHGYGDEDE